VKKSSTIARLFEEFRRVTIASGGVWQAEIDSHLIYPMLRKWKSNRHRVTKKTLLQLEPVTRSHLCTCDL